MAIGTVMDHLPDRPSSRSITGIQGSFIYSCDGVLQLLGELLDGSHPTKAISCLNDAGALKRADRKSKWIHADLVERVINNTVCSAMGR